MALLDDLIADHPGYTTTAGGARLTQILADLEALPKTDEFPQENFDLLVAMLESPVTEWGHKQLTGIILQVCAALGVNDRELNHTNVASWRSKYGRKTER